MVRARGCHESIGLGVCWIVSIRNRTSFEFSIKLQEMQSAYHGVHPQCAGSASNSPGA